MKKVHREAAIWVLDLFASSESVDGFDAFVDIRVAQIAEDAFFAVPCHPYESFKEELAEAACLLREGWSPGDPIFDLKTGEEL